MHSVIENLHCKKKNNPILSPFDTILLPMDNWYKPLALSADDKDQVPGFVSVSVAAACWDPLECRDICVHVRFPFVYFQLQDQVGRKSSFPSKFIRSNYYSYWEWTMAWCLDLS